MASKIPAILDELATRLATVPGVAAVYSVLDGAPLPAKNDADLPAIHLRLVSDAIESTQPTLAKKVAIQIAVELFFLPSESSSLTAVAAAWIWEIRHALLAVAEDLPFYGLLRADPAAGIDVQGASYHYPQQLGDMASVRQPLLLRLVETY